MLSSSVLGSTSSRKRRRVSGLTGLELRLAYNSLIKVKESLQEISVPTSDDEASEVPENPQGLIAMPTSFEEALHTMLTMMESKLDGPHVCLHRSLSQASLH